MERDRLGPGRVLVAMLEAELVSADFVLSFLNMDTESKRRAIIDQFVGAGQTALQEDPEGSFAKSLGWSRARSEQIARASRSAVEQDVAMLTPGEPVNLARWSNGATCKVGDRIQLVTYDSVNQRVGWGESFGVAALRQTGPEKYDIYSEDQPGLGVAEVTYLGRKQDGSLFVSEDVEHTKFLERPDAMTVLNPPPPTRQEWSELERRIGLDLPESLFEAFSRKDAAICGERLRFPQFANLEDMHPVRSHRFFPICRIEPCGDFLCLYVPQEDVAPFVVIHRLELGHVVAIAEDPEAFFREPEKWRRRMDLYQEEELELPDPPPMESRPWLDVIFDREGRLGELEFLKDLALSQEEATEAKFFERTHSRFGQSCDPVRVAICQAFPEPSAALDPQRWLNLSEALAAQGRPQEAMRALENFTTVIVPQALDDGWERVADAYERMLPLARNAGRAYDVAVIPNLIRLARR